MLEGFLVGPNPEFAKHLVEWILTFGAVVKGEFDEWGIFGINLFGDYNPTGRFMRNL